MDARRSALHSSLCTSPSLKQLPNIDSHPAPDGTTQLLALIFKANPRPYKVWPVPTPFSHHFFSCPTTVSLNTSSSGPWSLKSGWPRSCHAVTSSESLPDLCLFFRYTFPPDSIGSTISYSHLCYEPLTPSTLLPRSWLRRQHPEQTGPGKTELVG